MHFFSFYFNIIFSDGNSSIYAIPRITELPVSDRTQDFSIDFYDYYYYNFFSF